MGFLVCTRVTGLLLEDLTLRHIPLHGEGRTGMQWTGECI